MRAAAIIVPRIEEGHQIGRQVGNGSRCAATVSMGQGSRCFVLLSSVLTSCKPEAYSTTWQCDQAPVPSQRFVAVDFLGMDEGSRFGGLWLESRCGVK